MLHLCSLSRKLYLRSFPEQASETTANSYIPTIVSLVERSSASKYAQKLPPGSR